MNLKKFTGQTKEAYDLLFSDFKPVQIFDLEDFDNARKNGHYNIYYFYDEAGTLVGYAFCGYAGESAVQLDFIAIFEEHRKKRRGLGSELLRQLIEALHPMGILAEVEPEPNGGNPGNSRYRFFQNMGFVKQNIKYILPEIDENNNISPARYTILYRHPEGKNLQIGADAIREMFREYTEKVLPESMPEIEDEL
ncbi:MAG: GNAT family N-acetyltransferase [Defluviitaleaceae bacterium]|nr:GNAT family N-acetyltransferase [Defluviitaleaceae bacterium]